MRRLLARRSRARRAARRRRRPPRTRSGNFSVNHLADGVGRDATACDVHYVLDQAEIPTFQERGLSDGDGARAQARRGRGAAAR